MNAAPYQERAAFLIGPSFVYTCPAPYERFRRCDGIQNPLNTERADFGY